MKQKFHDDRTAENIEERIYFDLKYVFWVLH